MESGSRFDLGTLEFATVRELLAERLRTPLARHAAAELEPWTDVDRIARTNARVAALTDRLRAEEEVPLSGAVELRSWLPGFLAGEHLPDGRNLADLKRVLRTTERCRSWLSSCAAEALQSYSEDFPQVRDLAEELEGIVDDRGEVLSTASMRLGEIRREIDLAEAGVRSAVSQFVSDPQVRRCLQTVEPAWRHGRPVFQVRQEMRHRVDGILHDRSQTGATLFIEPTAVVDAANRLSDAKAAEHREIQVVLSRTARSLRRYGADIEAAEAALANLDLDLARCQLVLKDGYCIAPVADRGTLRLRRALHPLLLRQADAQDLVPLDLTLGEPYQMLVVTGPNTGGKTVALKTVGLLALMAHCAVPIPAEEGSCFPLLDGVFADIGDAQGITQNLSTFSSHLTRIVRCLKGATERSLVLLDELGAGTDPEEGGALGYAVLEELVRRRCPTVVTTHLGRLKDFAYQHAAAENGAMAFERATLRPLYRLEVGIAGTSHALDIAGRVGVGDGLVQRARDLMGERDTSLEEEIERVQSTRREAEVQRTRTEQLRREADAREQDLAQRGEEMERKKAWLDEEAAHILDQELHAARELLAPALGEFRNAPRPWGERAEELLRGLDGLFQGTSLHRRRMRFLGGVRKGQTVYVPKLGKLCTVKKVDRTRERITIELGKLRMELAFEDVSWIQPIEP